MATNENNDENLAFVFPPGLSKKIKRLQSDMNAKSAGEVLLKALALLELSLGRKVQIKGESSRKWEVDDFEELDRSVDID